MTNVLATPAEVDEGAIADLLRRLTTEEKVALVSGGSAWGTVALPAIGLRSMVLSDGPSGVRGEKWDERYPSLCLPSATALAASWDTELAREYGRVVAAEAREHNVDVVLGPTVNLHRSPLGGRHFEAFSEDPVLTSNLASAYVEGVQSQGVGASIKHYVANDYETDRFNADTHVHERVLRELYLPAFERAVTEARVWSVMSAYNSINGVTATESSLLDDPLKEAWGFDGVVVSDWTAVRSLNSARASQDLAMPGPSQAWGPALLRAIEAREVDERDLDLKVERILRLAWRVGALDCAPARPVAGIDGVSFARRAAADGMVLLTNDSILPLSPAAIGRIAVLGQSASQPRLQGGGSATVLPAYSISPLDGIREAFPDAFIDYIPGVQIHDGFVPLEPGRMTNPVTGTPGAMLTHLDSGGNVIRCDERFAAYILDYCDDELRGVRKSVVFETLYAPREDGELQIGFASPGAGRLFVDGELVLDREIADDSDQVQAFFSPPSAATTIIAQRDRQLALRYEFTPGAIVDGVPDSLCVTFGIQVPPKNPEQSEAMIAQAADAARFADVAIVVVGTNDASECEGFDRDSLRLPGEQDALVSAVVAANPRTIVVINAGAPVEMPWRDDVAAILLTWFGGQEYGHALADVLAGRAEPGGRLPTSWPETLDQAPVTNVTPQGGVVRYDEGLHIGYRAYQRAGIDPAFSFGSGLGYTTWELRDPAAEVTDRAVRLRVDVRNSGARFGKCVVQVYLRLAESRVERPGTWLAGFDVVRLAARAEHELVIDLPSRAFAYWDCEFREWQIEPGSYEVFVGTAVDALLPPIRVELG